MVPRPAEYVKRYEKYLHVVNIWLVIQNTRRYCYNSWLSDNIILNRNAPDARDPQCAKEHEKRVSGELLVHAIDIDERGRHRFKGEDHTVRLTATDGKPKVTIIIQFFNELLSALLRSIISIVDYWQLIYYSVDI